VATIALARGMLRLAKDRVIIKELSSVETLGSTGVICTDKTGTLTENEMSVHSIFLPHGEIELEEEARTLLTEKRKSDESINRLLETGVLCNNVQISGNEISQGDPIEVALVELALAASVDIENFRAQHPEIVELPFDTETKMMAVQNQFENGYRVSVKGALENVLHHCDEVLEEGGAVPISNKEKWLKSASEMAAEGLRTLAFAYRESTTELSKEQMVNGLTFLGLVGFIDPPRLDVKDAIQTCKDAGIRVVMVTGDHPETARSIAQSVGLLDGEGDIEKVFTGKELGESLEADSSFKDELLRAKVFARVNPSQKLKLVDFYQKNKFVVGMTGDGVNDAPALKKADIGIAMGIRGTEAAKEVADVILRDDQFTSIELAIRQGRIIFENIRNFVVYLLSSNLAEIIAVALASISNLPLPLLPLQILYLNLVTDVFPALALGLGEGQQNIMKHPPRPLDEPIMPKKYWLSTIIYGLGITTGVLGITVFAHFYLKLDPEKVNNLAFYTLVLAQLLNVLNLPKRDESFFVNEVTKNIWVWGALVLCLLLTFLGYILPPLREVLSLVPITSAELFWVLVFSLFSLGVSQLVKRMGGTV
jgi:Ca2+-transporting ATPase